MLAIVRAAVDRVSAARAVGDALATERFAPFFSRPVHVIAAGKGASAMAAAVSRSASSLDLRTVVAVGTHRDPRMPSTVEWREAAHPIADARSVAAAGRALEVAAQVAPDEGLLLLLSGGASALLALPAPGLSLADKQQSIEIAMRSGADIHALNTVRKHLSGIKGGRLAAACRGATLTLAISDVVGDDLSVIGSGPGVADPTTWHDAAEALRRYGGLQHPAAVRELAARGEWGEVPDTPKPGDPALARAVAEVIASRREAIDAAREAAERLGYRVVSLGDGVVGQAREVAPRWLADARARIEDQPGAWCVLSAGETTVRVTGCGRGGRNQEFALALAEPLATLSRDAVAASVGTDGIDGPTDAAGALVDRTTMARAGALGLTPAAFLDDNNAYEFFGLLGDLIHLGRTDTNVGDVQVLLVAG